ncbi:hypothetical protein, partial [Paraburkholderia ginsengiterrae]|uniref:hypothetical protein n=1 Tax=Paraburkholderia ginsengiterrae TaxID=1462993 RepID=UPI001ABF55C0
QPPKGAHVNPQTGLQNTQVEISVVPETTQPPNLPLVSITRNYFFQIGCGAGLTKTRATQQPVKA